MLHTTDLINALYSYHVFCVREGSFQKIVILHKQLEYKDGVWQPWEFPMHYDAMILLDRLPYDLLLRIYCSLIQDLQPKIRQLTMRGITPALIGPNELSLAKGDCVWVYSRWAQGHKRSVLSWSDVAIPEYFKSKIEQCASN